MIQTTTTAGQYIGDPPYYYYSPPQLYCPCCGQPRRQWYTPQITYTTPPIDGGWTYTNQTATPCADG